MFLEDAANCILFKQTNRIAHPSLGKSCDELKSGFLRIDVLGFGDESQTIDDIRGSDTLEIITLCSRDNRVRDLMDLGRREDEFDVCRWFFEGFEEGIEGSFGEHMHLVDDVDLVSRLGRLELGSLNDVADIVDSRIGCGIDFDDVEEFPLIKGTTVITHSTWIPIRSEGETIHSLGEDSRHTRFPRPSRSMEQIRPNGAIKFEGILQHLSHKDLSEQRMKISRAVFLMKRHEKTKKIGFGASIWKMSKKTNF